MHGKDLPVGFLQPVGTPAITANLLRVKGKKFHLKGEEGLLVGFDPALLSYRILTPHGSIIKSKHVRFLKKPDHLPTISASDEDLGELKISNESSTHAETQDCLNSSRQQSLNRKENELQDANN
ncbi:hypothetical protein VP01_9853g1 [Puccinia sorghi]|uniref:Uncharacterized protein n=1 Tax=Puccinia sorghi TaxID=27349 RepID=A0A0L6U5K5_9BASI|nr:hypothetical protein VP01_9853g1 [Puccinia sorghi]